MISIITPSLNRAAFIREAVESVPWQEIRELEHLIVDGGSTDGTLKILDEYSHLRVITEPDNGVYDALNKGIRAARGEIIGLLNSDDLYAQNVLDEVVAVFQENPTMDGVFGGALVFEDGSDGKRRVIHEYNDEDDKALSFRNLTIGVPITNARFFRRRVFDRIGLFDTRYRIAADRDFLIRAALSGLKGRVLDRVVYCYRQHPGSLTIRERGPHLTQKAWEYRRIAEEYLRYDGAPDELKRYCRLWSLQTYSELTLAALYERRFRDALQFIREGFRFHKSWPLAFVSYLFRLKVG